MRIRFFLKSKLSTDLFVAVVRRRLNCEAMSVDGGDDGGGGDGEDLFADVDGFGVFVLGGARAADLLTTVLPFFFFNGGGEGDAGEELEDILLIERTIFDRVK